MKIDFERSALFKLHFQSSLKQASDRALSKCSAVQLVAQALSACILFSVCFLLLSAALKVNAGLGLITDSLCVCGVTPKSAGTAV